MSPYRSRSWHSTIVEDAQGRTVCAAASVEDRNRILAALNAVAGIETAALDHAVAGSSDCRRLFALLVLAVQAHDRITLGTSKPLAIIEAAMARLGQKG